MRPNFHSNIEQYLKGILEGQATDILFECFVGLVTRSTHTDPNSIHVIPQDNFRRSYRNDIVMAPAQEKQADDETAAELESEGQLERCYFPANNAEHISMYTSRSAILDYLPEGSYMEPDNTDEFFTDEGEGRSIEAIEAYRQQRKEQVKSANCFFKPLEIAYNKVRVHRELREVKHIENADDNLVAFWSNFQPRNEKWKRFIRTLHLIPYVMGDKEKTKALIEYVLNAKVELEFSVEEFYVMNQDEQHRLNGTERTLGYNISLGNRVYDYQEICTLKIEDVNLEQFYNYFDEAKDDRKLLHEIIKYYFPINLKVQLDFSIELPKEQKDLVGQLEEEVRKKRPIPILGYSSVLGQ